MTNREIAFRVWDLTARQMEEARAVDMNEGIVTTATRRLRFAHAIDDHGNQEDPISCVLMQYTGVIGHDQNRIYEGDIVRIDRYFTRGEDRTWWGVVAFQDCQFGVNVERRHGSHGEFFLPLADCFRQNETNTWSSTSITLEGNVWENPTRLDDVRIL